MAESKILPVWAEDLRKRYLRGESSMFILHGNVYDVVLNGDKMLGLTEFLTDVLLKESRESIVVYNVSSGATLSEKDGNFCRLAKYRGRNGQGESFDDARTLDSSDGKNRRSARIRRINRACRRCEFSDGCRPRFDCDFASLVISAGNRTRRQYHNFDFRKHRRTLAENRFQSENLDHRNSDARIWKRAKESCI